MKTRVMNTRALLLSMAAAAVAIVAVGCGGGKSGGDAMPTATPAPTANPNAPPAVQEAQVKFPRFLDLQIGLFATTCSPNPGVCHNSSNYPNFQTAGDTIAFVEAPCNPEIPDPTQGWDNCERKADRITVGGYSSEIAWAQRIGPGTWTLGLKTPAATGLNGRPKITDNSGTDTILDPPVDWGVLVTATNGATTVALTVGGDDFIHDFVDSVLKSVIGGDPNRNGVWGAEDPTVSQKLAEEFFPGAPDRSYVWGRLTGTVPGTRMPLANAPLTEADYVALACWMEGLKGGGQDLAEDRIDYDHCVFAQDPTDYTVSN